MTIASKTSITVTAIIIVFIIAMLGWALTASDPSATAPGKWLPIPLACTSNGCITSWHLARQAALEATFADATSAPAQSITDMSTTLIRQHLVHHAEVKSPISRADGQRYREEILNLTDESAIATATGLSTQSYDEQVVVPFLEQENLRQARSAESTSDLFSQLAGEQSVFVLHLRWDWNKATAIIE
ncbi:hypothetical protein CL628_00320 [bacterium]|nr:hypothetical protein [bacterium]|tara:strand:+ start:248 stop:808 length:561 start_codon:yes stop_codon:yes gene_type:complete